MDPKGSQMCRFQNPVLNLLQEAARLINKLIQVKRLRKMNNSIEDPRVLLCTLYEIFAV